MSFDLHRPATISEAVGLATRLAPAARYIAGGTDLIIQINRKKVLPDHLIDLGNLPGLVGENAQVESLVREGVGVALAIPLAHP